MPNVVRKNSLFRRKYLSLTPPPESALATDCTVLVINSSQEMAKEITLRLALDIPGCAILYAPTVDLAKLLLFRRKIDLVISAPILPDGAIEKLRDVLMRLEAPPDILVVGRISCRSLELLGRSGYEVVSCRRIQVRRNDLAESAQLPIIAFPIKNDRNKRIRDLGALIRNDLNNPLQEIVAMIFVAKFNSNQAAVTDRAFDAISKAAQTMALVVKGLEDKITAAVANEIEPFMLKK